MENIVKAAVAYAQIAIDCEKKRDYAEARKYYERASLFLERLRHIPSSEAERGYQQELAAKISNRLQNLPQEGAIKAPPKAAETEEKAKEKLILVEKPDVKWESIGGLQKVKETLKDVITIPLKHPDLLKKYGVLPWKGVLLFGPPGCGKTLLAKAAATECDATFFEVPVAEISSKWFGESEKNVRDLFESARNHAPSIIFFDEIDAISPPRDGGSNDVSRRVVDQMLREMDGMREDLRVLILAATNYPEGIDRALLRPKRFDKRIYSPPPDYDARREIFKINTRKMPVIMLDFGALAERTEGHSGADIYAICNEVGWRLLKEELATGDSRKASMEDFTDVISNVVKPSISASDEARYLKWEQEFGTM